jgi:hypothetical protein
LFTSRFWARRLTFCWMWLEFNRCSAWEAVRRLLRSASRPVSREGRPNCSRNELVILPSGRLMERWSSGMKVNGSGMALEYFSVVPVIWHRASMRTSASRRRRGYQAKSFSEPGLWVRGIDES